MFVSNTMTPLLLTRNGINSQKQFAAVYIQPVIPEQSQLAIQTTRILSATAVTPTKHSAPAVD